MAVFFKSIQVIIINTKKDLEIHLSALRKDRNRIGLIPTMGALHQGHLTLLEYIKGYCDIRVCSIFVNPTQFNNLEDLEKYPRPIEEDVTKLEQIGCDVLFMPEVDEMYSENEEWNIDLEGLESILEGAFRPGHFKGVTQIVKKLFDLVKPDVACFGQKDYQQYLVIERMVRDFNIPVELKMCPTVREESGLAMSSRNIRLSSKGRDQALSIYKCLHYLSQHLTCSSVENDKLEVTERLKKSEGVTLEYFEICNPRNLTPIADCEKTDIAVALIAAWVDGVRLIDNMLIKLKK